MRSGENIYLYQTEQKSNSIPCPEDLVRTFFESLEPTEPPSGHAVLPYIKGLTEPLTHCKN